MHAFGHVFGTVCQTQDKFVAVLNDFYRFLDQWLHIGSFPKGPKNTVDIVE